MLLLLKAVIGQLVKNDPSLKSIPQCKVAGFLQEKYNDFCKEDIMSLTIDVEIAPKFEDGLRP
jgi:hypothetical protein